MSDPPLILPCPECALHEILTRGRRQHSNCEMVIPISVSFSLPLKRNSKILKDNHLQEGFLLGASPYEIKARAKTLYEHLTTQNPDDTSIDVPDTFEYN